MFKMSKSGGKSDFSGKDSNIENFVLFSKTEIRVCTIMFGLVSKHDIYKATELFLVWTC